MKHCKKCALNYKDEHQSCPCCKQMERTLHEMQLGGVPYYMHGAVDLYIRRGICGEDSFIQQLFANSFTGVMRKADRENMASIHAWAIAMYWAPMACRGKNMPDWSRMGGMAGQFRGSPEADEPEIKEDEDGQE